METTIQGLGLLLRNLCLVTIMGIYGNSLGFPYGKLNYLVGPGHLFGENTYPLPSIEIHHSLPPSLGYMSPSMLYRGVLFDRAGRGCSCYVESLAAQCAS